MFGDLVLLPQGMGVWYWVLGVGYWVFGVKCWVLGVLVLCVECWVILSNFLRDWVFLVLGGGWWVLGPHVQLPQGLGVGCLVLGVCLGVWCLVMGVRCLVLGVGCWVFRQSNI